MRKNNKKKPLIRALEPRMLFDGAAVTTLLKFWIIQVLIIQIQITLQNTTDSTVINDATIPDATHSAVQDIPMQAGDVVILTTDTPNYEATAQNLSANFKVLVLDESGSDLNAQIQDATKDTCNLTQTNIHIVTTNQSRDRLLVGSYDTVDDLLSNLTTSDSKLYDLVDYKRRV